MFIQKNSKKKTIKASDARAKARSRRAIRATEELEEDEMIEEVAENVDVDVAPEPYVPPEEEEEEPPL